MRQQLRLNVLIPVAVLGLLGAGFGAYAMGGAPGPDPVAAPVATTTAAAPTAPAQPAKPKPGPVTAEAWATGANALCVKANLDAQAVTLKPATVKQLRKEFARLKEFYGWFNPALKSLGWPQGQKAATAELWRLNANTLTFVTQVHRAFKARNYDRVLNLIDAAEPKIGTPEKTYRKLGARACADTTGRSLRNARGTETLEWMLVRYRTVVVVFYAPESSVDAETVIEARAAALDAGAGFVAVNVKREAQVAAMAIGYEVLGTPTVLVFTRGPKLRSHFELPVDRITIAQAVTNARR
jgi:hypothetical protein